MACDEAAAICDALLLTAPLLPALSSRRRQSPNAGKGGKLVSALSGAAYPSATGIPASIGYQVTGPFFAGCISCANASLDASGVYSAICGSAPYPNALAGSGKTVNRGFIVPFANLNASSLSPAVGAYTCTTPPGAGNLPTCVCNAPAGTYAACQGITPPSPPPSPPTPPPYASAAMPLVASAALAALIAAATLAL